MSASGGKPRLRANSHRPPISILLPKRRQGRGDRPLPEANHSLHNELAGLWVFIPGDAFGVAIVVNPPIHPDNGMAPEAEIEFITRVSQSSFRGGS